MTVKKVIGECLVKMGQKDFCDDTNLSDEQNELLNMLLCALNIAYREAVTEYLPLIAKENVSFVNGELNINTLQKQILYPVKLTEGENAVSFKTYPNRITAALNGSATLEYAYTPTQQLKMNSSIEDMRLTQSVLSDGTLAEFYFANKVFDLAKNYDTAFRSKLSVLRYKGRRLRLKARGWQE